MKEKIKYQRCLRCNRALKNDIAKERGYGNYCWKLHKIEIKTKIKPALYTYLFPNE